MSCRKSYCFVVISKCYRLVRDVGCDGTVLVVDEDRAGNMHALDHRDRVHGVDDRGRVDDGLQDRGVVDDRSVVHDREGLHDRGVVDGDDRGRVDGNSLNDRGMVHNVPDGLRGRGEKRKRGKQDGTESSLNRSTPSGLGLGVVVDCGGVSPHRRIHTHTRSDTYDDEWLTATGAA